MTFSFEFCRSLSDAWQKVPTVQLRPDDQSAGLPAWGPAFVCFRRNGQPSLTALLQSDEWPAFHECVIVGDLAFVGFGRHVLRLELTRRTSAVVLEANWWTGRLYLPSELGELRDDHVYATTEERVVKLAHRGDVVWRSEAVGLDGVTLDRSVEGTLHGEGEWDPPGGGKPFVLDSDSGAQV